jgi:hypothetical protein
MNNEYKYSWQPFWQDVAGELSRDRLKEKFQKLESAVFDRVQALSSGGDRHEECEALEGAISKLREIQKENLPFSD